MRRTGCRKTRSLALLVLLTLGLARPSVAREVTVVLKNGRYVMGTLLQEEAEYLLLHTELGEVKIHRRDIEGTSETPFVQFPEKTPAPPDTTQLNDQVIVYLTGDRMVDGSWWPRAVRW